MKDYLLERKEEEIREKYILQAFNAWLGGAGEKKTFKQFLKHLKLDGKEKKGETDVSKEDAKRKAAANIENAKRIILLDQSLRQKKEG